MGEAKMVGRLTLGETRRRLRHDRERLRGVLTVQGDPRPSVWWHPSYWCVFLYRLSTYFYRGGHRYLARLFWHLNALLTGADISPPSDLAEGLVILNPPGTAISAAAGRNLTVMALAGLGSELGRREDIGAGPGLPVVGDDVILEPHAGVLGPVRIGDRARIRAGTLVYHDVPDDALVDVAEPRFFRRKDLG